LPFKKLVPYFYNNFVNKITDEGRDNYKSEKEFPDASHIFKDTKYSGRLQEVFAVASVHY
jgi:hypothetical protein